jgi:hypothetical protein
MIFIHYLFKNFYKIKHTNNNTNNKNNDNINNDQVSNNYLDSEIPIVHTCDNQEGFDVVGYDFDECPLTKNSCPIDRNDHYTKKYVTKYLFDSGITCDKNPKPPKTVKQFHKDFFSFRDKTYGNSSMREDPVDKIQRLYLDGNNDIARRYPNMRIKDLYDEITAGPKLYERQCVRLPNFDNVNPEGYYMSAGSPALTLTRSNWTYPNEKIINGGSIDGKYCANDPEYEGNFPVNNN